MGEDQDEVVRTRLGGQFDEAGFVLDSDSRGGGFGAAVLPVEAEGQGGEGAGDGLADVAGAEQQDAGAGGVDAFDQGVTVGEGGATTGERGAGGVDHGDGADPLGFVGEKGAGQAGSADAGLKRVGAAGDFGPGGGFEPGAVVGVQPFEQQANVAAAALLQEGAEGIVLEGEAALGLGQQAAGLLGGAVFEIAAADGAGLAIGSDQHAGPGLARGRALGRHDGDQGEGLAAGQGLECLGCPVHRWAPPACRAHE